MKGKHSHSLNKWRINRSRKIAKKSTKVKIGNDSVIYFPEVEVQGRATYLAAGKVYPLHYDIFNNLFDFSNVHVTGTNEKPGILKWLY